ncbi:MAG: dTDP-4-dehydrorhamnose reductase [Candidatus Magasanikbacteria bacterium CG11_big_fil_rev_8_21_14_0_20_39_34]|uniref:dTDP-4-dehydrorhamnose reductase n=1 Tax=Candidatus Magasanikbacteria bacterium CG11_big_fil_rev_8_21_14_0_20_39_34 TaxID=1974653 RepID=A0A2H0N534_9BACT|nr:MAG: dTDP-4-dehydrorhamnose reductase [Candidatus Magasanikbacteria bacterium CG11_big_fil_rev_8_21_14_0_20_39_34]
MKKILILGAKGTLGGALVEEFSGDATVIAWDKEDLDLAHMGDAKEKIQGVQPDIIINAVAINAVDAIEEDEEVYEVAKQVNGHAPGELAKIAKELSIPFVHYSTDYVFDGENTSGYQEDDIPHPLSRYGYIKRLGEQEVENAGGEYFIIRLSRLFGKPGISEHSKRSFVDTMIFLATEGGKTELNVVEDQFGSPTYAPDLAKFTRHLLESGKEPGIYHGANDGSCSWYQWCKKVFEIKGITIPVHKVPHTDFPRPAPVPQCSTLKNTKFQKQRTWQEALEAYLAGK